jgi:endoglucanase
MTSQTGINKTSAAAGVCLAGLLGVLTLPTVAERVARGQIPDAASERAACDAQAASGVPQARLALLERGFNLTSWLDGPQTRRPDLATLAKLRQRGLTHVRLPVTPERLLEAFSGADNVRRDLKELDRAIDTLIDLGFGVSLDMHPGDRLGPLQVTDPQTAFDLFDGLWRQLAHRYANRPAGQLFFEVLNEPTASRGVWDSQGPRLAATIRKGAPDHTIIYGSTDFQRIDALANVAPLRDVNVVYAAHFYDPLVFTHQGQDWSDDPLRYIADLPFPAHLSDPGVGALLNLVAAEGHDDAAAMLKKELRKPWTEERVAAAVAQAGPWIVRFRRPVIVNEFGVFADKAPAADRARWLRTVRRAAEAICMGWAHWDYADGFGFVHRTGDREVPDEKILKALLDR